MSESRQKIKNVDAFKMRDLNADGGEGTDNEGRYPRRWPGKVTKKLGKAMQGDSDSGEWKVEITSKRLEDPVIARVNEDREVGMQVQFHLDEQTDPTGKRAETFFEFIRNNPGTREAGQWRKNRSWHKNTFSDSDYE